MEWLSISQHARKRKKRLFFFYPISQVFEQSNATEILWNKTLTLGYLTDIVSSMVELVGPHTHYTGHQLWWHSCLLEGKPIGPLQFHCILRCQLIYNMQSLLFHHISIQLTFSHLAISVLSCVKMSDLAPPFSSHAMIWANQFMLYPFRFRVSTNALKFCSSYFLVFLNIISSINI